MAWPTTAVRRRGCSRACPRPEEAARLGTGEEPVLVIEAIDVDPEGRPIRYGATCFAGARVQLTVAPEPGTVSGRRGCAAVPMR